jgi:hypothetical protein
VDSVNWTITVDTNCTFMWPCCIVTNFFIIKPTRCTNFPNLLRHETLHVSGSSSAHHQELFSVHSALVYVVPGWNWFSTSPILVLLESCLPTCMTYTSAECTEKNSWWWAEELPETCRVSCRSKFGKLLHLVGFIVKTLWTHLCSQYEVLDGGHIFGFLLLHISTKHGHCQGVNTFKTEVLNLT